MNLLQMIQQQLLIHRLIQLSGGMNPLETIPKIAMIEPGEAAEVNPAPNNWNVNVPDTPPAITARNIAGFIITYGSKFP